MTHLPITTSPAQAAVPAKQPANAAADSGDSQTSQPFGEVLARQTSGQTSDQAAKDTRTDDRNAIDMLAQLGADPLASGTGNADIGKTAIDLKKDAAAITTETSDPKKTAGAAPDSAGNLPADMLAAMLVQAAGGAAVAPAAPAAGAKPDSPAPNAGALAEQRGLAAPKADATTLQAGLTQKAAAETRLGPQLDAQAFAAARETAAAATQPANATMLASMQQAAAPLLAPAVQPAQASVNTPITQEKWADEFSQKITWLASSKQDQTAELHLNPPQLGPVDVVLKVSGDQATALFTSPHAAVRDAIEQAMPKLRDMLADNGIMLGNATVSDQTPRDQGQQAATQRTPAPAGNDVRDAAIPAGNPLRVSPIARHNGIVDTFA